MVKAVGTRIRNRLAGGAAALAPSAAGVLGLVEVFVESDMLSPSKVMTRAGRAARTALHNGRIGAHVSTLRLFYLQPSSVCTLFEKKKRRVRRARAGAPAIRGSTIYRLAAIAAAASPGVVPVVSTCARASSRHRA